ncbi:MAG: hypothetical protein HYV97_00390 [Bdellovibrio sp.]|nr:hypothetical protein [Bdellovibrio sp.]
MRTILNLFKRDSTPIGAGDFFKKTLGITYWVLPINLGFLFLWKWKGADLDNCIACAALAGLLINNFIALWIYAPLWDRRLTDFYRAREIKLRWYLRALWGTVTLSPIIGLYFHILFSRVSGEAIHWSLKKHFTLALICSSLIQGILTLSFRPMLTANFNTTVNYVTKVAIDASRVLNIKTKHAKSIHVFLDEYRRQHKKDRFGETGQILADASAATIVYKTNMVERTSRKMDENNLNAYLELVDSVIAIQQMGFSNVLALTYPYGLYLFIGNIELPILMAIEVLIYTKKKKLLIKLLSEKHPRTMDVFRNTYKKTLSRSKYKYYEKKLNIIGAKIESMKLKFSYF